MILPDRKLPKALAAAVEIAKKKCSKKELENVEIARGRSNWTFTHGSTSTKGTANEIAKVLGYWSDGVCAGKKSAKKSAGSTNKNKKLTAFMDANAHVIQRGLLMGAMNSEREARDPSFPAFGRRMAREDAEKYRALVPEISKLMGTNQPFDDEKPKAKASKAKPGASGLLF